MVGVRTHLDGGQVRVSGQLRFPTGLQHAAEQAGPRGVVGVEGGGALGEGDSQAVLAAPRVERGALRRVARVGGDMDEQAEQQLLGAARTGPVPRRPGRAAPNRRWIPAAGPSSVILLIATR